MFRMVPPRAEYPFSWRLGLMLCAVRTNGLCIWRFRTGAGGQALSLEIAAPSFGALAKGSAALVMRPQSGVRWYGSGVGAQAMSRSPLATRMIRSLALTF